MAADNKEKSSEGEKFLSIKEWWDGANPYGDFFQETSDGNISIGPKAQKSPLEIATTIGGYVVPLTLIIVGLLSLHVFIRTQENNKFAENYTFICPYLTMGISGLGDRDNCLTANMARDKFVADKKSLETDIISILTEYIPIKVSKNIIDASPEKKFIIDTFEKKVFVNDIMSRFETIQKTSQYIGAPNIECNGISITNGDTLSTQCTVYGWAIGDIDDNRKLGSARIEALRFLDIISNTGKSNFILMNPPSSLSVEKVTPNGEVISPLFQTKTIIPVQIRYVPFNQKI
jgi:hypothetical protein